MTFKNVYASLLALLLLPGLLQAQNTVGVVTYVDSLVQDGYNLYYPHNQPNVYLFDNCGRVVNMWPDSANFRPGNWVYLLEDGNLVKSKRDASVSGDVIWAGGGGDIIEIRDWDNNLQWSYSLNDSLYRLHHDHEPLPNGNILVLAWERKLYSECVAAGRDTALLDDNELWPEMIYELQPVGTDSVNIVWEWHLWDHLVQDYDSTKPNFGVVTDHPEWVDLNYVGSSDGGKDWNHANSIDYNSTLDQIVLSIPTFNEVWIIDHSTSTAQSGSHSGGLAGRGGDLLFRWGNPMAYDRGDSLDMKLVFQHDVHWIDDGLTPGADDYGKLMIYNNRIGGDYSSVSVIEPLFDTYDWEYIMSGNIYAPADYDSNYTAPVPQDMFSSGLSSAQRLRNGNTLILTGRPGWAAEVTPDGDYAWEYINPLVQGTALSNGDTVVTNSNLVFRMKRYYMDYGAFDGRDLTPGDYIELNPDTLLCAPIISAIDDPDWADKVRIFPNPASGSVKVRLPRPDFEKVEVFDLLGQRRYLGLKPGMESAIDLNGWAAGMYLLRVDGQHVGRFIVH